MKKKKLSKGLYSLRVGGLFGHGVAWEMAKRFARQTGYEVQVEPADIGIRVAEPPSKPSKRGPK